MSKKSEKQNGYGMLLAGCYLAAWIGALWLIAAGCGEYEASALEREEAEEIHYRIEQSAYSGIEAQAGSGRNAAYLALKIPAGEEGQSSGFQKAEACIALSSSGGEQIFKRCGALLEISELNFEEELLDDHYYIFDMLIGGLEAGEYRISGELIEKSEKDGRIERRNGAEIGAILLADGLKDGASQELGANSCSNSRIMEGSQALSGCESEMDLAARFYSRGKYELLAENEKPGK